jgi:hypothetical protein
MAARKPFTFSGTSMIISPFICTSNLLAVFERIHSRDLLGFLTPDKYTGVLLRRSHGGGARFSTWAVVVVVPLGVKLRGQDTLPDAPGDVRLGAASEEAADTAAVPVLLAVGLSVPLGLLSSA